MSYCCKADDSCQAKNSVKSKENIDHVKVPKKEKIGKIVEHTSSKISKKGKSAKIIKYIYTSTKFPGKEKIYKNVKHTSSKVVPKGKNGKIIVHKVPRKEKIGEIVEDTAFESVIVTDKEENIKDTTKVGSINSGIRSQCRTFEGIFFQFTKTVK